MYIMTKNQNIPQQNPNRQHNPNRLSRRRKTAAGVMATLALVGGVAGVKALTGGEDVSKGKSTVEQVDKDIHTYMDIKLTKEAADQFSNLTSKITEGLTRRIGQEGVTFSQTKVMINGEELTRGEMRYMAPGGRQIIAVGTLADGESSPRFNGNRLDLIVGSEDETLAFEAVRGNLDSNYSTSSDIPGYGLTNVDITATNMTGEVMANISTPSTLDDSVQRAVLSYSDAMHIADLAGLYNTPSQ